MPTLIIENMPASLFNQVQRLAELRKRTPADTVVEVLRSALSGTEPLCNPPALPDEPFLTLEISPPFDIPWPKGETVEAVYVRDYLPEAHDIPTSE